LDMAVFVSAINFYGPIRVFTARFVKGTRGDRNNSVRRLFGIAAAAAPKLPLHLVSRVIDFSNRLRVSGLQVWLAKRAMEARIWSVDLVQRKVRLLVMSGDERSDRVLQFLNASVRAALDLPRVSRPNDLITRC